MSERNLTTDEGLRSACAVVMDRSTWDDQRINWVRQLAGTLAWVRSTDEGGRATRDFQYRLWEQNHVAAVGQGQIPVDAALDDSSFREWLAARSMQPLPADPDARTRFLTELYEGLKDRLVPVCRAVPHLKIFRVMAALYPAGMTTVASAGMLDALTRAMGSRRRLPPVERHVFVRTRIDSVLGAPSTADDELALRMTIPWLLYEEFVLAPSATTSQALEPSRASELVPLPAARRRRGLTAIKGLFPAVLSALEFVRDGVTRPELLDFLRAASPESKASSLGMAINVLQSELGVIKAQGDRYILTARGEDVLESQDPTHLSDWLLTGVLGVDKALAELRDKGPRTRPELLAALRTMNPGWTADFAPQAIISWLRSMGVIASTGDYRQRLTEVGAEWAARVHWTPEPLADEPDEEVPGTTVVPSAGEILLPPLSDIVPAVQQHGHFPPSLLARLHTGLWAPSRRHFAVLTGLSGSGKTLLARAYGKAVVAAGTESRLLVLPVQPGWYDPGALLGYVNPLRGDTYVRTPFLDALIAASAAPTQPHVVVLDEMNLSHPEQYMAPLLSAMETGGLIPLHSEGELFDGVPRALQYPSNLVLIGTVNMDETTHGLSDKVLDRAFVLEFWDVDLDSYPRWKDITMLDPAEVQRVRQLLSALMKVLAPARLHFGWRVVDDVIDFVERAAALSAGLPLDAALDSVIYAKVLPKLRGEDGPRFRDALSGAEEVFGQFGLVECGNKVAELRRDLQSTGTARFWR